MSFNEKPPVEEKPKILVDNIDGTVIKTPNRYEIATKDGYLMVMNNDGQETRRVPSGFFSEHTYQKIKKLFAEAKEIENSGNKKNGFKFEDPEQALKEAKNLRKLDLAPDDEENTETPEVDIKEQEEFLKGSSFATDPDYYKDKK